MIISPIQNNFSKNLQREVIEDMDNAREKQLQMIEDYFDSNILFDANTFTTKSKIEYGYRDSFVDQSLVFKAFKVWLHENIKRANYTMSIYDIADQVALCTIHYTTTMNNRASADKSGVHSFYDANSPF